jgi:magnesium-transporting ATPase (P-type)
MELLQIGVGKEKYAIKGDDSNKLKTELEKDDKESLLHHFFTALAVCHTVVPEPASEADETEHEPPQEEHHFLKLPQFILHSKDKKEKSPESDSHHKSKQGKGKHDIQEDQRGIKCFVSFHIWNLTRLDFVYQAASPDEGALVEASRELGYTFVGRSQNDLTINVSGQDETYAFFFPPSPPL